MKSGEKFSWQNAESGTMLVGSDSWEARMHDKKQKTAPKKCVTATDDANEQAASLTDWNQKYDQVGSGRFYGRIDELRLGDMQVYNEHSSQTLHQQCMVREDAFWFGIPSKRDGCRINGQAVEGNDILCRPGSRAFDLVTPDRFDMLGIVIAKHDLTSAAEQQGISVKSLDCSDVPRLQLPQKTLQQISYLLGRIINSKTGAIDSHIHYDLLMIALLEVLKREQPNDSVTPSYHHRKAVVERIREHIERVSDLPLTMAELCEVGCVSRRTLQYSFESILGMSPSQFLRVSRLNRVKRLLSKDSTTSVSDAAAFNGFYHLSQFAADYKQLFGELPSQTLARHTG